jgi:hypothetical protein
MKNVSRWMLGLVTSAIPVVIAACYGVAYTFSQRGRVVDKSSKAGVAGLKVECRSTSNAVGDISYSESDGQFSLFATSSDSCTNVRVTDEREVGTHYATTTVPSNHNQTLTIEVEP